MILTYTNNDFATVIKNSLVSDKIKERIINIGKELAMAAYQKDVLTEVKLLSILKRLGLVITESIDGELVVNLNKGFTGEITPLMFRKSVIRM